MRVRGFGACLLLLGGLALPVQADVTPGQVITAADREKLRGLIPDELYPLVVQDFPALQMRITETRDYPPHPKFVEATVKGACQATISPDNELVGYKAGQPFPYSEWAKEATHHACDLSPTDPQLGLKIAWDIDWRWQGSGLNTPHFGQSFWRGKGDNTWKVAQGSYRRTYFSHRADLLPGSTDLIPGTDVEFAEYTEIVDPFDLRGTAFLTYRYLDSVHHEDQAWAYVPDLRRVRRMAPTQKSDSILGSDYTMEDLALFSGYVWEHDWKLLGESTLLAVMDSDRVCFPENVKGWQADGIGQLGTREEFDACPFGPYKALPLVGERWQKRKVLALEQIPKRPDHPYSKRILWYDKETLTPLMSLAYDREGKPFRVMWYIYRWSEDGKIPGNEGKFAPVMTASSVVNLRDHVSNLFEGYTTNLMTFSAQETKKYFDTTRLKAGH